MSERSGADEEYESLRMEIFENSRVTANVFVASTTVTTALIGYGLSSKTGPIFLSPFAVLIPSLYFIASQLESTTRISQYMRVFLEPQVGRHWQTRWDDLRSRGLLPHRRKYTLALTSLYVGLALTCMVLAAAFWRPLEWRVFALAAVPLAGVTIAAIAAVIRAFSTPLRESYAVAWQLLKDSETPLGTDPAA